MIKSTHYLSKKKMATLTYINYQKNMESMETQIAGKIVTDKL